MPLHLKALFNKDGLHRYLPGVLESLVQVQRHVRRVYEERDWHGDIANLPDTHHSGIECDNFDLLTSCSYWKIKTLFPSGILAGALGNLRAEGLPVVDSNNDIGIDNFRVG